MFSFSCVYLLVRPLSWAVDPYVEVKKILLARAMAMCK